jgi:hypothetical protein
VLNTPVYPCQGSYPLAAPVQVTPKLLSSSKLEHKYSAVLLLGFTEKSSRYTSQVPSAGRSKSITVASLVVPNAFLT